MRHAQQTCFTQQISPPQPCSPTRRKKHREPTKGRTLGRHPSANRERQPRQTSVMRKLDYTSRFVRVILTLSANQSSHNSTGHGGRKNMGVTASTSQQISKLLTPDTGAMVKSRKGYSGVKNRKRYMLPVERKRPLFEGRPVQFLT